MQAEEAKDVFEIVETPGNKVSDPFTGCSACNAIISFSAPSRG